MRGRKMKVPGDSFTWMEKIVYKNCQCIISKSFCVIKFDIK